MTEKIGNKAITVAKGVRNITIQGFINSLIGAILFLFISRSISQEEMGLYGALTLTVTIGIMLGILGLDYAASRYISYLKGQNKHSQIKNISKKILTVFFFSSIAITILFFFLSNEISLLLFDNNSYVLLIQFSSLTILPSVAGFVTLGFLQGFQTFSNIAVIKLLSGISRLITAILLINLGLGVLGLMASWAISSFIIIIFGIPIILKQIIKSNNSSMVEINDNSENPLSYRELFLFSFPMMGVYLFEHILNAIDQYVVLAFLDLNSLGSYFVAATASTAIISILGAPLIMTLTPTISEVHGKIKLEGVSHSFKMASRYISLFFTPATFLLAALSPVALYILGGAKYYDAILPLSIMSIGLMFYGLTVLLISSLTAIAKTKIILIVLMLTAIVELISSIILTYLYGIQGAAFSRAITFIMMFVFAFSFAKKYFTVSIDKKIQINSIICSIIMGVLVYIIAFSTNFNILLLPVYLFLALIIYSSTIIFSKTIVHGDILFAIRLIPKNKLLYPKFKLFIQKSKLLYGLYMTFIGNNN